MTRDDWIVAARKALTKSGIDGIKVDGLARRMRISRGSFYHHFRDRRELLDALLDDWIAGNRREIEAMAAQDESGGMLGLFRFWLGSDPKFPAFDIAVRVWARKSRSVAGRVRDIDDRWIALLQARFEASGMPETESFVRARIMHFHQIGYHALSIDETLAERARLAPYYCEALTAAPAPESMEDEMLALGRRRTRSVVNK